MWRNSGKDAEEVWSKKYGENDGTGYRENKKGIRGGGEGENTEEEDTVEREMEEKQDTSEKETEKLEKEKKEESQNTQEKEENISI